MMKLMDNGDNRLGDKFCRDDAGLGMEGCSTSSDSIGMMQEGIAARETRVWKKEDKTYGLRRYKRRYSSQIEWIEY